MPSQKPFSTLFRVILPSSPTLHFICAAFFVSIYYFHLIYYFSFLFIYIFWFLYIFSVLLTAVWSIILQEFLSMSYFFNLFYSLNKYLQRTQILIFKSLYLCNLMMLTIDYYYLTHSLLYLLRFSLCIANLFSLF